MVEGLGSYVRSVDELPEEAIELMKKQAQDDLYAYVARDWEDEFNLEKSEYIGKYFLTQKSTDSWGEINKVVLVYRNTVKVEIEETDITDEFVYYSYAKFRDIIKMPDGTASVDLTDCETRSDHFTKEYDAGGWFPRSYYIYGYEDLNTLFNKIVTSQIDEYNYESDVHDL